MKTFFAATVTLATSAAARTFTLFTDLNVAPNVPAFTCGWEAKAYTKVSFHVPDNWKAGRIWGRRNCKFATNPGPNSCLTDGCNGGLQCNTRTGTYLFLVSLVDGYNLPMRISNNVNCPVADCAVDLGPNCPAPLKGPFDASGFPVGCRSACEANLDGNQRKFSASARYFASDCISRKLSQLLLRTIQHPQTCPASGVAYYSYFKNACPRAYAYAYDEASGTALWTCNSALKAYYTLTFCP
ncbi:thaumatin [Crassisporium funariophilum]|nr:thaumatin [Crassisporium funariophilum]